MNLLEKTSEGEIRFIHTGNQLKGYPKEHFSKVRHITEASQAILVCTTEGLLTFASEFNQPEKIHFYQNQRTPDTVSSLSSNDVTYAYTDSRKTTYVLTFTGGVNKVLSESMLSDHIEFKPYTTKDGLPSDLVLSMIEGNDSSLWVVSENALTRFDPEKETFEYYDKKYTRQELYFTEAAPVQDQNHQLMLGTDIGILRIIPEHLKKSKYAPPIVFTGFKIQGASQDLHINDLDELRLKPSERNVTFQFAALDYVDSESISYAYRLKGLEENWNEVDNSRSASYINLPPGEYELQRRSVDGESARPDYHRTSHFLGDLLGMDALHHIIHFIYGNHCLHHSLYLPVAPPDKPRTATDQYQVALLYGYLARAAHSVDTHHQSGD